MSPGSDVESQQTTSVKGTPDVMRWYIAMGVLAKSLRLGTFKSVQMSCLTLAGDSAEKAVSSKFGDLDDGKIMAANLYLGF